MIETRFIGAKKEAALGTVCRRLYLVLTQNKAVHEEFFHVQLGIFLFKERRNFGFFGFLTGFLTELVDAFSAPSKLAEQFKICQWLTETPCINNVKAHRFNGIESAGFKTVQGHHKPCQ